jgi:MoaD family protein
VSEQDVVRMVKVVFSSAIRSSTNGEAERDVALKGNVSQVLAELAKVYGDKFATRIMQDGKPRRFVNIYVNGKDIRFLQDVETQVGDGDTVDLIPAVSGGSGSFFYWC